MATLTLKEIYEVAYVALRRCGAGQLQADIGAQSVRDAEADGIRNVGLNYLPIYLGHLRVGKLVGDAEPTILSTEGATMQVDAAHGFAHTAFLHALPEFTQLVNDNGIGLMSLQRSYSAGVVGWFNDLLAKEGLVSLAFANAPSSVTPYGGKKAFFGTNPLSFGAPRENGEHIIIDMATSTTAKVNVKQAAKEGREIPLSWALDSDGQPTSDAKAGLAGGLAPLGGAKGFGLGLMVDILAAGLTGGNFSFESPSFGDNTGGHPNVGQTIIGIAPEKVGGAAYLERLENMLSALVAQEGVRLPGMRRHDFKRNAEENGIDVPDALLERINSL